MRKSTIYFNKNNMWKRKSVEKSGNKKVRNAREHIVDGIKYRSGLEVYMATLLKENNLSFEYEAHTYTIFEGFTYAGVKVRPITYTPDFVLENHIIECKGWANDVWPIKLKLFKRHLVDTNNNSYFHMPKNKQQCEEVINKICSISKTIASEDLI